MRSLPHVKLNELTLYAAAVYLNLSFYVNVE